MKNCLAAALFIAFCAGCEPAPQTQTQELSEALGGIADAGFARAFAPRTFSFPDDHAAHPAFRNEWWYFTGNLFTPQGRQFGYQVTLFRIALSPAAPVSVSNWATNQVWMAHVALTDVQNQTHHFDQRLARGAAGLAGQALQPFRVWLEDWRIEGGERGEFPWTLAVKTDMFSLQLNVQPEKPPVLQGEQGLSQKSAAPGNASYYYSLPRLRTEGTISLAGSAYPVRGLSWLDREWSTSALADDQIGWDWFSLHLHDGHDVMFYRLRKRDGTIDEHSRGSWTAPDGTSRSLDHAMVRLQVLQTWQGYPVSWLMTLPGLDRAWRIDALVDDQEMATDIRYWEGAVRVRAADSDVTQGYGYLEMTGYRGNGAERRPADG